MKIFPIILLFLICGINISAQTMTAAENEVAALDRKIQDAIASGDVKTIERFIADDMIFTHGFFSGATETKKDFLAAAKLETKPYVYRKTSAQRVELHGNFAMVLGRLDVRRQPIAKNNETEQICYALNFIHLFEKRKKRWQLISHRAAQLLEPMKPCGK
ncbi:MAG: nuclear transport factor 2 family protein [Pyrinomonadaceae bacterium]|nr:nuclear transport factor 2 family protein [Pyrinomonadaceae bacterium]